MNKHLPLKSLFNHLQCHYRLEKPLTASFQVFFHNFFSPPFSPHSTTNSIIDLSKIIKIINFTRKIHQSTHTRIFLHLTHKETPHITYLRKTEIYTFWHLNQCHNKSEKQKNVLKLLVKVRFKSTTKEMRNDGPHINVTLKIVFVLFCFPVFMFFPQFFTFLNKSLSIIFHPRNTALMMVLCSMFLVMCLRYIVE